jgi:hypothetical protein
MLAVAGLAGCATPRSVEADNSIHKVVVVTALDESGTVNKIGLTIFNNDATAIAQDGALSRTAVDTITERLRRTRPNWQIVPAGVDLVAIGAKDRQTGFVIASNDALKADVAAIVRNTGADAVFLVTDMSFENTAAPGRGVGVALRKLPGIDPHVVVRAHVWLELQDSAGARMVGAPGGETPLIKASDLGLTDDIASVNTPEAKATLSEAMRRELRRDLEGALTRMGY